MSKKPMPRGVVVDKQSGEAIPAPQRAVELVLEGLEIDQTVKPLSKRIQEIKTELKAIIPAGMSVVIDDIAEAPVTLSQRVVISDERMLRVLLGTRFNDLVNTNIEYQPTEKLIEMAADADNPLAQELRQCLDVKETVSIAFKDIAPRKRKEKIA